MVLLHISLAGGCLPSADDFVEIPNVQIILEAQGQGVPNCGLEKRQCKGMICFPVQTFPPSGSRYPASLTPFSLEPRTPGPPSFSQTGDQALNPLVTGRGLVVFRAHT